MIVIDDSITYMGSCNLDIRSFYLNAEIIWIIESAKFATQMKSVFEDDLQDSERVHTERCDSQNIVERFKQWAARILTPVL